MDNWYFLALFSLNWWNHDLFFLLESFQFVIQIHFDIFFVRRIFNFLHISTLKYIYTTFTDHKFLYTTVTINVRFKTTAYVEE